MREWEQATWAAGQTEEAVIRRVGELLARRARRLTRAGDRILILAGRGHNGDDARCAEPHLQGRQVELIQVRDPGMARADLAAALSRRPVLVIDGLFGIGLNRPLGQEWTDLIETVNGAKTLVLAVDVPSGLNGDTGEPMGGAIRAALTLTLGAPKRGLIRSSASPFVGRLEVAPEIGLTACPATGSLQWTLPADFAGYPPPRSAGGHKGTYGHLAIVAGSLGYHGAAVLAARGAQRAQPGLITLLTAPAVYQPVAAQLQAVMVQPWSPGQRWPNATALLFGPGLAAPDLPDEWRTELCRGWRESALPILADASGLDWLPEGPTFPGALRVITPHPGEAARLLKTTAGAVQADRPAALRTLSARYGNCWVVLKGHQTLVGRKDGELLINSSGNAWLGQGGSGDVLAGFLGGLLAQPALQADPLLALRYGVWQHGAAADQLTSVRPNWVIEELLGAVGQARGEDTP
jgi:NAD(P)H-hydrate epimerase